MDRDEEEKKNIADKNGFDINKDSGKTDKNMQIVQEQAHYRMILDMTGTAFFEWDSQNGFYASEKFYEYELSKYGIEGVLGKSQNINYIYDEDLPKLNEYMINGSKTGDFGSMVVRMKMKNGSFQYTEITGRIDFEEDGSIKRLAGVMKNVNKELQQQYENLQEAQKKYELEKKRTVSDKSMIAYAIFDLQKSETLELVRNKQLKQLPEGVSLKEFRDDVAECIIQKKQREQYIEIFNEEKLIRDFKNGIEERKVDFQRRLPEGKIIWVRAKFTIMKEPWGTDTLLLYSCNDINISKTQNIMTSFVVEEDYDVLGYVNFTDDSCVMWCGKNSIIDYKGKKSRFVQEKFSTALEWFIKEAVVSEEKKQYDTKLFTKKIKRKLLSDNQYIFQLHLVDRLGRLRTKEIRYVQYDPETNVCLFTQKDITDLLAEKEKEQKILDEKNTKLEQLSAYKSRFLSNMSHEIRTPMNGIIGMTNLALDSVKDPEALKYLVDIDETSKYMLGLLNDVLDMSHIDSGKFTLKKEWTSAKLTLWSCINMMEHTMMNKNIKFIHPDTTVNNRLEMFVDGQRLKQVIMNLLNNAYKFTPNGGTVTLELKNLNYSSHSAVDQLIVRDTGCGMSKEFLANGIFQPFVQDYNGANSEIKGTGLGLALVKQIIIEMGGTIEVNSELEKGTTFTVTIPYEYRVMREEQYAKKFKNANSESDNTDTKKQMLNILKGKKVLIVEDHPLNQKIISLMLQKKNMEIKLADNGQMGVDIFNRSPENWFDIILMDVRMPVLDGYGATKAIRLLDRADAKTIPIIAMTANAFNEDKQESILAGMNEHLSKPINPEDLYKTLVRYIQ